MKDYFFPFSQIMSHLGEKLSTVHCSYKGEWMKRVLKLLVWIFMLSRLGLVPGSNISKIYGLKFEKTQILEFSLQNDSF